MNNKYHLFSMLSEFSLSFEKTENIKKFMHNDI